MTSSAAPRVGPGRGSAAHGRRELTPTETRTRHSQVRPAPKSIAWRVAASGLTEAAVRAFLRSLLHLEMRIVGGTLSGRRFSGPRSDHTRPTSDRVREGVFSALEARGLVERRRVLDLFAGTGALSFEALSRGAEHAVLVEKAHGVARAIDTSARQLGLSARVRVRVADLERRETRAWLDAVRPPLGLVLIDPPYAKIGAVERLLATLRDSGKLGAGAAVVVEHARREPPTVPLGFAEISRYRYGDTAVLLARVDPSEDTYR